MAITRSQQAKQMLQDGGMLVKPGFGGTRQGYRGPGGYQGGRKDTAPGAAKAGSVERGGGSTNRERGITQQFKGPKGTTGDIRGRDADPKPPQVMIGGKSFDLNPKTKKAQEQKNFAISIENDRRRREALKRALKERTFLEKLGMLGYTNRTLDSNLEDVGAIGPQGFTVAGIEVPSTLNALSEFTVDPATKFFDQDSIREIGSQTQYTKSIDPITGKETFGTTARQADILGDIREDIQMRDRILDPNDKVTNEEFQKYLNRNKITSDPDTLEDPCKGPNPPAYCFVGIRSAGAVTPVKEDPFSPNLRLLADGGRAAFRGGDAAKSDRKSGRDAGRADERGGVERGRGARDRRKVEQYTKPPTVGGGGGGNGGGIIPDTPSRFKKNIFDTSPLVGINTKNLIDFDLLNDEEQDNTLMAKVYGAPELTEFGATPGFVKDTAKFNDMEKYQEIANKQFKMGKEPSAIRESIKIGSSLYGIDMDNIPKDFLKTKEDFKNQKILGDIEFADGGRAGLAEGGMPYEGGIMDLESARQMYGLGKLVKKVTRSVKKIAKSPIGKAAIGAALFKFGGPLFAKGGKFNQFFFAGKAPSFGALTMKGALTGITGISALAGLTAEEDDNQTPQYAGADLPFPVDYYLQGNYPSNIRLAAEGGLMRAGYQEGSKEPVAKKTMPLLDMGGMEKDYREEGGFVPIGRMEKADDVPARLSKNEFVFTADAVRNAGDGDVDLGAEKMYNMMKNLEAGGDVSEESQGMDGARKMFQTSQRLEEVI